MNSTHIISAKNVHDNDNTVNDYLNSLNKYLNEVKIDFTTIPSCDTDSEDYDLEDDNSKTMIFNIVSPIPKEYKGVFLYSFLVKNDLVELKTDIDKYKKREFYEILESFYFSLKSNLDSKPSTFNRTKMGVAFLFETIDGEYVYMFIDDTGMVIELKDKWNRSFLTKNYIKPNVNRNIEVRSDDLHFNYNDNMQNRFNFDEDLCIVS